MPDGNSHAMTILTQALKRTDPAVRTGYLDGACGDDTDLRERVEALLATHGGAGRFPEHDPTTLPEATSSPDFNATSTSSRKRVPLRNRRPGNIRRAVHGPRRKTHRRAGLPTDSSMGQVIAGRYRLIGVLGEGGMGTVYRAEQTQPVRRPVALKLIRVGLDSRAVLARFDAERQALALMDHPNIARVYDGGTTAAGQPFFVMELVTESRSPTTATLSGCRCGRGWSCSSRSARPCSTHTRRGSSTATSSRRTCWSPRSTAGRRPRSSTSAWPRRPSSPSPT